MFELGTRVVVLPGPHLSAHLSALLSVIQISTRYTRSPPGGLSPGRPRPKNPLTIYQNILRWGTMLFSHCANGVSGFTDSPASPAQSAAKGRPLKFGAAEGRPGKSICLYKNENRKTSPAQITAKVFGRVADSSELCPVLGAAVVLGLAVRSAVWRSPLVLRGVAPLPNTTLASHAQTAYFSAGVAKRMRPKFRDKI